MKILLKALLMLIGISSPMLTAGKSFVFSVKPGLEIQSSDIGYTLGNITPYVGLDVLAISAEGSYAERYWGTDWETGDLYLGSEETWELSGSATLIIPHLGIRYQLSDKALHPFISGGFFKSFAFASVKGEHAYRWFNTDGDIMYEEIDVLNIEEKEKGAIEDILGIWGLNVGLGVEYPFNEHLSICGESGFRLLFASSEYKDSKSTDWNDDGNDDWREEWNAELSGSLKLSYAAIALRFHF